MTRMTSSQSKKKTLLELACELKCQSCVQKVQSTLSPLSDVTILDINLEKQTVVLEVALASTGQNAASDTPVYERQMDETGSIIKKIQNKLEIEAGIRTVIKGIGQSSSAVAELMPPLNSSFKTPASNVMGVIRLAQMSESDCYVDGVIGNIENWTRQVLLQSHRQQQEQSKLQPQVDQGNSLEDALKADAKQANESPSNKNGACDSIDCSLNIHEYGDLSGEDFANVGPIHRPLVHSLHRQTPSGVPSEEMLNCQTVNSPTTDTSSESVDSASQVSFKFVLPSCNVASLIGRSIALMAKMCTGSECTKRIISAGIIARSSPVGFNPKRICDCSGKSLWQERSESKHTSY